MCVLDCSPTALKILHNSSEFLPYVIFIAAPGIRQLAHFYDNSRMYNGGANSSRTFNVIFVIEYTIFKKQPLILIFSKLHNF